MRRAYFEVVAADAPRADRRSTCVRWRSARATRRTRASTAGDVPQSDLTQSELALASSENDLVAARGEADATRAELNVLLGQPADTPLTLADALTGGATADAASEALALATQSNAELQLLDRRIAEQTARINLAKALTTPDVAVGGTFTYDAEPEFRYGWRVSVGVTVPVFTRHQAGVLVEEVGAGAAPGRTRRGGRRGSRAPSSRRWRAPPPRANR